MANLNTAKINAFKKRILTNNKMPAEEGILWEIYGWGVKDVIDVYALKL